MLTEANVANLYKQLKNIVNCCIPLQNDNRCRMGLQKMLETGASCCKPSQDVCKKIPASANATSFALSECTLRVPYLRSRVGLISEVEIGKELLQWKLWSDKLICLLTSGEISVYKVRYWAQSPVLDHFLAETKWFWDQTADFDAQNHWL